jgi:hypothetical protein
MKRARRLIRNIEDIKTNLVKVELYLLGLEGEENKKEMTDLIGKGTDFVAYEIEKDLMIIRNNTYVNICPYYHKTLI